MGVSSGGSGSWAATDDPDVLVRETSGGCGGVVSGVTVAVCGVFFLGDVLKTLTSSPVEGLIGLAFCLGFVYLGASLAFLKERKVLDRRARTIEEWWGFFTPTKRQTHSIDNFQCVGVLRKMESTKTKGGKRRRVEFRVCLGTGDPDDILVLYSVGDEEEAREDADRIAEFFGMPRQDA